MPDFAQRTKSYTDARLFEIIREAEKYAPEAVDAAQAEIESRSLREIDFPAKPDSNPFGKLGSIVEGLTLPKSNQRPDDVIDWIEKPDQENNVARKYLLLLLAVTGLGTLIQLYNQLDYLRFVLGPLSSGIDFVFTSIVVGILFQAFIVFMLWRRKRIGFQLAVGYAAYSLTSYLGLILYTHHLAEMGVLETMDFLINMNGLTTLLAIGIPVAIIWLASRTELRELFSISRKLLIRAIAIGIALSFFSQLYFRMIY